MQLTENKAEENETENEVTMADQVFQLQLFEDVTHDDVRKSIWLLNRYAGMIDIIKNYELAKKEMVDGLSEYDHSALEGKGKRESGIELISDVTGTSVVLKEKRERIYVFYKRMSNVIGGSIRNIRDPHEQLISKMLFMDGMRVKRVTMYLTTLKTTADIYPIGTTTFFEKRRRAISRLTNSFKINGTLDYIEVDRGAGRNKDGECKFKELYW